MNAFRPFTAVSTQTAEDLLSRPFSLLAVFSVGVFGRVIYSGRHYQVAGRRAVRLNRCRLDGVRKWKPVDVLQRINTLRSSATETAASPL